MCPFHIFVEAPRRVGQYQDHPLAGSWAQLAQEGHILQADDSRRLYDQIFQPLLPKGTRMMLVVGLEYDEAYAMI